MRRFMRIWVSRIENGFATRFACVLKLTAYCEHIYMPGFIHYQEIAATNFFFFFLLFLVVIPRLRLE